MEICPELSRAKESNNRTMSELPVDIHEFCQMLACIDHEMVPVDLFQHASASMPCWSSIGDIIWKSSTVSAVPSWLRRIWATDTASPGTGPPATLATAQDLGLIQFVTEKCIQYVKITDQYRNQIYQDIRLDRRRALLFEFTAIAMHAFPSKFTDLLWDTIALGFIDVIESCVLPLLAVASDTDLLGCCLPKER
jgi:hypothetical protein